MPRDGKILPDSLDRWDSRHLPGLGHQVARGSIGSLTLKLLGTGISFFLTVTLARVLGPQGYGIYAFILALITFLAIPAQAGLPQLVVRETARADAHQDWGLMRGLWRWSSGVVLLFSLAMIILGVLLLWLGSSWLSDARWRTLVAGMLLVPLVALGNIKSAALRGLRHVVVGQLPDGILRPTAFLAALLVVPLAWPGFRLAPEHAMAIYSGAAALAYVAGAVALHLARPTALRRRPTPEYQVASWGRAAMPLALLAGLQLINGQTDIIMLGALRTDQEVGVYKVVYSVATLAVFGLQAVNQVLQPYFARLYSQGEMAQLQRIVTHSARVVLLVAIPPVFAMIAFPSMILGTIFGGDYEVGAISLAILALGQLVNASMGSVGVLLNMTGHEKDTVRGVGIAAISNIVLNFALIPPFGMEGAAIATAITLVIWNLILRRLVSKRLGIESSAVGARS